MSTISDALAALKQLILLEDRIAGQGRKLEQLAVHVIEMDRRLAALEGRIEGFMAAASAFGNRPVTLIEPVPVPEIRPLRED